MTGDAHKRAKHLIDATLLEDISEPESLWLEAHLTTCDACGKHALATRKSIQAFRRVAIPVDPELARRTQRKVRARAQEIEQAREDVVAVWVAGGLAAGLTAITTPLAWSALGWLGQRMEIPGSLLQLAYVWFWLVPSLSAALLLVYGHEIGDSARIAFAKRGE
jgi:anti-sigma factor RsiW